MKQRFQQSEKHVLDPQNNVKGRLVFGYQSQLILGWSKKSLKNSFLIIIEKYIAELLGLIPVYNTLYYKYHTIIGNFNVYWGHAIVKQHIV